MIDVPTMSVKFSRNALTALAELSASDGGRSFVVCNIPGGTPWFTFDLQSQMCSSVGNAPSCDNFAQFKSFVIERFIEGKLS